MRTDKIKLLNRIKDLYENKNINIIKWLKQEKNEKINDLSDILISYDFQAGTYINYFKDNKQARFNSVSRLAKVIDDISVECNSILDCGVGEATDLVPLLESVNRHFDVIGGFDLSWSRIKYAQNFIRNEYKGKSEISLFVRDLRLEKSVVFCAQIDLIKFANAPLLICEGTRFKATCWVELIISYNSSCFAN